MYDELTIDTQELQMCQYIPHHRTCGVLHGHTYVISNIRIRVLKGTFLDFGEIKAMFKEIDHRQFFPEQDREAWNKMMDAMHGTGIGVRFNPIWLKETTVEFISDYIVRKIRDLAEPAIKGVSFTITEGNHQGVNKVWGLMK